MLKYTPHINSLKFKDNLIFKLELDEKGVDLNISGPGFDDVTILSIRDGKLHLNSLTESGILKYIKTIRLKSSDSYTYEYPLIHDYSGEPLFDVKK